MKSKILICFGTRPEWLKIKPLVECLKNVEILYTGQHDSLMDEVLKNHPIDYSIHIENDPDRLNSIIGSILKSFPILNEVEYIMVQGDTASAYACALAAYNRKIKVVHLEAGLRSHDLENPFPEEGYRQMISRISSINLCPTELSKSNLEKENCLGKSHVVGNTVLDNLIGLKDQLIYSNKVLITLHRRENHSILKDWIEAINGLANEYTDINFYFIKHPNPNVVNKLSLFKNVQLIDPLPHTDLIEFLRDAKLIITDSGGLQEEGSFLNKKIIVCRKVTERPEGIQTGHIYLCQKPEKLFDIFKEINSNPVIEEECPYGDGFSAKKINKLLSK